MSRRRSLSPPRTASALVLPTGISRRSESSPRVPSPTQSSVDGAVAALKVPRRSLRTRPPVPRPPVQPTTARSGSTRPTTASSSETKLKLITMANTEKNKLYFAKLTIRIVREVGKTRPVSPQPTRTRVHQECFAQDAPLMLERLKRCTDDEGTREQVKRVKSGDDGWSDGTRVTSLDRTQGGGRSEVPRGVESTPVSVRLLPNKRFRWDEVTVVIPPGAVVDPDLEIGSNLDASVSRKSAPTRGCVRGLVTSVRQIALCL